MLLVDDVDNRDLLHELFEAMYDELPMPKKKDSISRSSSGFGAGKKTWI